MISKQKIKIGNKIISEGVPVFIIAEGGVNHNGSIKFAKKLIDVAANAGADAIKFQTWRPEQLVIPVAKMADYQKENIGKITSQLDMLRGLQLPENWYGSLIRHAKKRKIIFLSAAHGGFESVDLMNKLKIPAFKLGSGELNNLPLLEYTAKFKKPMLISTGMGKLNEVLQAIKTIRKSGNNQIMVFQCTTDYPCQWSDVNLLAMQTIAKVGKVLVGYSDHTLGSQVAVMATAMGARVIEKHITLSKEMPGPDHKASSEPHEFKQFVDDIRRATTILGDGVKKPSAREAKNIPIARKSVVSLQNIKKGEKFTKKNLGIKRPGNGLAPVQFNLILGKKARVDIKKDVLVLKSAVVWQKRK